MKKLFRNETSQAQLEKDYERIKRLKKRMGIRTFLLVLFLFGVNVFAWFVYISEAEVHTDANVAAWDLNFYDGTNLIKNIVITPEIYPGMQDVEKTVTISNASDVGATVVYTPKDIYFAGQITGVEGYVESISSGLVAGIDLAKRLLNEERIIYSEDTIIGSLANYISSEHDDFQPMNANFGLLKPLSNKIRDKKLRYQKLAERALKSI